MMMERHGKWENNTHNTLRRPPVAGSTSPPPFCVYFVMANVCFIARRVLNVVNGQWQQFKLQVVLSTLLLLLLSSM